MSFDPRDPPDPYEEHRPRDPYEYRDPLDHAAGLNPSQNEAVRSRLMGPAIFLLVIGAFNLLCVFGCIPMGLFCYALPPEMLEAQLKQQNPKQAEQMKQMKMDMKQAVVIEGHVWMAGGVGSLLTGVPILLAGIGMLRLRWYGLNVFGAAMAMISPAGCSCLLLGVVAGIWSLIVLLNPEVRAGFR